MILGPDIKSGIICSKIDTDESINIYIDFRSIDVSINDFERNFRIWSCDMCHIILDQLLGPENESGIIFSRIDTYRFDQYQGRRAQPAPTPLGKARYRSDFSLIS